MSVTLFPLHWSLTVAETVRVSVAVAAYTEPDVIARATATTAARTTILDNLLISTSLKVFLRLYNCTKRAIKKRLANTMFSVQISTLRWMLKGYWAFYFFH